MLNKLLNGVLIRTKLTATYVIIGIIPLMAVAFLMYKKSNKVNEELQAKTDTAMKYQIKAHLTSIGASKRQSVELYFDKINKQILTFSENLAVIEAMREYKTRFNTYSTENPATPEELAAMKASLKDFYLNQYDAEYRNQHDGQSSNILTALNSLPESAIKLQYHYISNNSNRLGSKHLLDSAPDSSSYAEYHKKAHPFVRSYLEKFGYYDIFLVDDETGNIVYSVYKELDYATSLKTGPYADTNFAEAFKRATRLPKGEFVLLDFKLYLPSYDNPASFIASPIFDGDERLGVAVFQLPMDTITAIMNEREGMTENSQCFLVGPDHLMRSDSYLDPEKHNVSASFRDPKKGRVDMPEVDKALKGKKGFGYSTGFHGNEVVVSYTPVKLAGLNWALIVEEYKDEAYAVLDEMAAVTEASNKSLATTIVITVVSVLVFCIFAIIAIANSIARPLGKTVESLKQLAAGKLNVSLDVDGEDEVAQMATAFNSAVSKIKGTVSNITNNSGILASSSEELSTVSNQMSSCSNTSNAKVSDVLANCEKINNNVKQVSANTKELGISINEISQNSAKAAQIAGEAVQATQNAGDRIQNLSQNSKQIGDIIEVINSIAEQTNLLALNASIEAARAGEQGRGFAVVANEVKDLAKETENATVKIRQQIEGIQDDSQGVVDAISQISGVIQQISDIQTTIAGAVEEQTATTREIGTSMTNATNDSEQVVASMNDVANAVQDTVKGASETETSAGSLATMAVELKTLVGEFSLDDRK